MSSQDTDPWELTFNKENEYTVLFSIAAEAANTPITWGDLYDNLRAQQPNVNNIQQAGRVLACKAWGSPGGAIGITPKSQVPSESTSTYNNRSQKFDAGDGVRRPTVEFSWPIADMTLVTNFDTAATKPIVSIQHVPNGAFAVVGYIYIKVAVKSSTEAVWIPATAGELKKRSPNEVLENVNKKIKVKHIKDLTLPVLNE